MPEKRNSVLLERIDSVTPLYRGFYTNVSKKAISTVLFAVSNVFLLYLYDILMIYLCNYFTRWRLTYMNRLRYTRKRHTYMNRRRHTDDT